MADINSNEEFTPEEVERAEFLFQVLEGARARLLEGRPDLVDKAIRLMTKSQLEGALLIALGALDLDQLAVGKQLILGGNE